MELDIIKTQTTWNDAAGSINNNFEKLRLAAEQGGGGGGIAEDVEVYIGDTEPTEDGAKLWINPAEEGGGGGGAAVEVVDSLESESTTAALSANQGRVLNAGKQDALVSGTNIKTINNQSILGSGNITIEGGGGGGGLETRILYVPEMTAAGSELTAEEKAYNVETVSKMLAGTARAAIAVPGMVNLTTTNALNLAAARYEGTLVVFESEFVTPFDTGFVIGTDGDILLNFPASSTIVIPDVDAVDFDVLSVAISYRSLANKLPVIYFAYEDSYYLFQKIMIVGNSYILDSDYTYGSYYYHARLMMLAGESTFERKQIPREVYIVNDSSKMQSNIDWITGYSYIYADTKPFVVYDNNLKYAPLKVSVVHNTHADFTIYRNGAFQVWRILASDGSASLIETIPIGGGGGIEVSFFIVANTDEARAHNVELMNGIRQGTATAAGFEMAGAKQYFSFLNDSGDGMIGVSAAAMPSDYGMETGYYLFTVAADGNASAVTSAEMGLRPYSQSVGSFTLTDNPTEALRFRTLYAQLLANGVMVQAYTTHNAVYASIDAYNPIYATSQFAVEYAIGVKRYRKVYDSQTGALVLTEEITE